MYFFKGYEFINFLLINHFFSYFENVTFSCICLSMSPFLLQGKCIISEEVFYTSSISQTHLTWYQNINLSILEIMFQINLLQYQVFQLNESRFKPTMICNQPCQAQLIVLQECQLIFKISCHSFGIGFSPIVMRNLSH